MGQPTFPDLYTLKKRRHKKRGPDSALLGLLVGIAFPCLGMIVLYFLQYRDYTFLNYLGIFVRFNNPYMMEQASKLVSLSMISNLLPFYYFLNRKCYLSTRGILLATMLSFVLIVLYKYVWQ